MCLAFFSFVAGMAEAQNVSVDKNRLRKGMSEKFTVSVPATGTSDEIFLRYPSFASHLTIESVRISKGAAVSDVGLTTDSLLFLKKIPNTVWVRNNKGAVRLVFASKISGSDIVHISMILSVESKSRDSNNSKWSLDVINTGSVRRTYQIPLPKIED
jgi:hypothetical protein